MDSVAVITGGSRGIGRAAALGAAKRGYRVLVGYASNKAAADEVVAAIAAGNGTAIAVKCDVGVEADILNLFRQADGFGRVAALVNNAGVVDRTARVDEMSAERVARMMTVNVVGSILCAREAVKRMSTKHGGAGGVIVNLSSVAATLGSPGLYVDYAASKGAIDTFTIGLAREVAGEGIRVNAIRPGVVLTERVAARFTDGNHIRFGGIDNLAAQYPFAVGQPEDIANAVMFLASDYAGWISGQVLSVDGGK